MEASPSLICLHVDADPATFDCWEWSCHSGHQCHMHQYPHQIMMTTQNCYSLCWHLTQVLDHQSCLEIVSFSLAAALITWWHHPNAGKHLSSRGVTGSQMRGYLSQRLSKLWHNQNLGLAAGHHKSCWDFKKIPN